MHGYRNGQTPSDSKPHQPRADPPSSGVQLCHIALQLWFHKLFNHVFARVEGSKQQRGIATERHPLDRGVPALGGHERLVAALRLPRQQPTHLLPEEGQIGHAASSSRLLCAGIVQLCVQHDRRVGYVKGADGVRAQRLWALPHVGFAEMVDHALDNLGPMGGAAVGNCVLLLALSSSAGMRGTTCDALL